MENATPKQILAEGGRLYTRYWKSNRESRRLFTPEQLVGLKEAFLRNSYPSRHQFEELSDILGMKEKSIRMWFQNKRSLLRKSKTSKTSTNDETKADTPVAHVTDYVSHLFVEQANNLHIENLSRILSQESWNAYMQTTLHCRNRFLVPGFLLDNNYHGKGSGNDVTIKNGGIIHDPCQDEPLDLSMKK